MVHNAHTHATSSTLATHAKHSHHPLDNSQGSPSLPSLPGLIAISCNLHKATLDSKRIVSSSANARQIGLLLLQKADRKTESNGTAHVDAPPPPQFLHIIECIVHCALCMHMGMSSFGPYLAYCSSPRYSN